MDYALGRPMGFTITPSKPAPLDQQTNLLSHRSLQPWFSSPELAAADARVLSRLLSGDCSGQVGVPRLALDINGNEVVFGNSSIVGRRPTRMSGNDEDPPADVVPIREGIDASDEGTLDRLVDLLTSDESEIRERAAQKLGELGDPRVVKSLFDAAFDETLELADMPIYLRAIIDIGDPAVEEVISRFSEDDCVTNTYLTWMLGEMGDVRGIQPIIEHLDSLCVDDEWDLFQRDETYQDYGTEALVKIYEAAGRPEDVLDQIVNALSDHIADMVAHSSNSRLDPFSQAIGALEQMDYKFRTAGKTPTQIKNAHLFGTPLDKSPMVARAILKGFEEMKTALSGDGEYDRSSGESILRIAVAALIRNGKASDVMSLLDHPHPFVSGGSFRAMAFSNEETIESAHHVSETIVEALNDKNSPQMRSAAALLIGYKAQQSAYPELRGYAKDMLADSEPQVRISAALTLGNLATYGAINKLLKLASEDENPGVRQAALMALQKIQEKGQQ